MALLDNVGLATLWNNIVTRLNGFAKQEDVDSSLNLLNNQVNQNTENIEILSEQISENKNNSFDDYIDVQDPNITLGKKSGATKILIDDSNNKIELKGATPAVLDNEGLSVSQINISTEKLGKYALIHNTQNNHTTIKWVGDN